MVEREIGNVQVKTSMVMEEGTRKDRRYEKILELFAPRLGFIFFGVQSFHKI